MHEQEKNKCFLVLRNVPRGCEIGIDYHSWYTGDKFQGISNVPSGFHFVFIRITDKYGEKSARTGFFVYMHPGEMMSKCFNEVDEEFEEIVQHLTTEDIQDLLKYMAPYPYKECKLWPHLTSNVTSSVLQRLQPASNKISSYTEVCISKHSSSGRMSRLILKSDSRPEQPKNTDDSINFTKIPVLSNRSPGELTKRNLDSTEHLLQLIKDVPEGEEGLIGEFQFAFISFLIGQVYDAFEHWKQLLSLVCGCLEAPLKKSSFYEIFLDTICLQLEEVPNDFFLEIDPQRNVIYLVFEDLFQNLAENHDLSPTVLRKSSILRGKLFQHFQWEFDDIIEDEMPTLVEL